MVRSHKDKRWDQMTDTIAKMKNSMKNNDWNAISADYDTLHKEHGEFVRSLEI